MLKYTQRQTNTLCESFFKSVIKCVNLCGNLFCNKPPANSLVLSHLGCIAPGAIFSDNSIKEILFSSFPRKKSMQCIIYGVYVTEGFGIR